MMSLNILPDEIFERILDSLPLVDTVRLRRVSTRFHLRPRTELKLDNAEIAFHLKQREIAEKDFNDMLGSIIIHFDLSVLKIQMFHPCPISMIVYNCQNLVELELTQTIPYLYQRTFFSIHFVELISLRKLRKLKAELSLQLCTSSDAAAIAERLQIMEEVSLVILKAEQEWFLNVASQISCLKVLYFCNIKIGRGELNWTGFSRVEGLKFILLKDLLSPDIGLLPEQLSILHLLKPDAMNIPMDLSALKCLPNLTELVLEYVNVVNYKFLQTCKKLESLDVIFCEPAFDALAFSNIPAAVALHHIGIHLRVNDTSLLDMIQRRNWSLRTIVLICQFDMAYLGRVKKAVVGLLQQSAATLASLRLLSWDPHNYVFKDCMELLGDSTIFPQLSFLDVGEDTMISSDDVRRFLVQRGNLEEGRIVPLLLVGVHPRLLEECRAMSQLTKMAKVIFFLMVKNGDKVNTDINGSYSARRILRFF